MLIFHRTVGGESSIGILYFEDFAEHFHGIQTVHYNESDFKRSC